MVYTHNQISCSRFASTHIVVFEIYYHDAIMCRLEPRQRGRKIAANKLKDDEFERAAAHDCTDIFLGFWFTGVMRVFVSNQHTLLAGMVSSKAKND